MSSSQRRGRLVELHFFFSFLTFELKPFFLLLEDSSYLICDNGSFVLSIMLHALMTM